MEHIVVVDTTWPVNSRTHRFTKSLSKKYKVTTLAWDRADKGLGTAEDVFVYRSVIGYGAQLKKLLFLPLFSIFCLKNIFAIRPSLILVSHWDSLLSVILYKVIFNSKVKLVYDCLDMPTHSNTMVLRILKTIERLCLKKVDLTIFASRYFIDLYDKNESLLFENYPSLTIYEEKGAGYIQSLDLPERPARTISWIGVVRYYEVFEKLLGSLEEVDGFLLVFGDGPDLDKVRAKVMELSLERRVSFFGRYELSDLPYIYRASNLVWAAYPTRDHNAMYAISNKYFECSMFCRRPVFSQSSMMIQRTLKSHGGVVAVDETSASDIKAKLALAFSENDMEFSSYEKNIYWEDMEGVLLDKMKLLLNGKA